MVPELGPGAGRVERKGLAGWYSWWLNGSEEGGMTWVSVPGIRWLFCLCGEMMDVNCVGGFEEAVPPLVSRVTSPYTRSSSPCRVLQRNVWTDTLPRACSSHPSPPSILLLSPSRNLPAPPELHEDRHCFLQWHHPGQVHSG